jgi:hypothetical protein
MNGIRSALGQGQSLRLQRTDASPRADDDCGISHAASASMIISLIIRRSHAPATSASAAAIFSVTCSSVSSGPASAGDDGSLDSDDPTFSGTLIRRANRSCARTSKPELWPLTYVAERATVPPVRIPLPPPETQ